MAYYIEDHTDPSRGGYLRLILNGRRVCDFFPYAGDGSQAEFVRQQAGFIAETMNRAIEPHDRS